MEIRVRYARILTRIPCAWCILFKYAAGSPNVAFPFNSQVPSVARVNEQYSFQFSDSTFIQSSENLTYSLSNQPAWLTVDSATRTLEGMPGHADAGSVTFVLTAADRTGSSHMPCTLVVSTDPAPQMEGDISKQIAASANLSSSQPAIVTILPSLPFHFEFRPDSFIDIVQRKLSYYATLTDHTPLPAWLQFNAANLAFTGTAPILSAFPQSWAISLIASDVAGFAGTTASFTVAVGMEQLAFVPQEQTLGVSSNARVQFTALKDQIYRNGAQLSLRDVKNTQASFPAWMRFDASTMELSGVAPANVTDYNIRVTLTDEQGSVATAVIHLVAGDQNMSLFAGTIPPITAYSGKVFAYHFPDTLFSRSDIELSISIPITTSWLRFDAAGRDLKGTVPTSTEASTIQATLMAKSASLPLQTQVFTIHVQTGSSSTITNSAASSATASETTGANHTTSTPSSSASSSQSRSKLDGGVIATIVILSLIGAVALLALLLWCCRREQRREHKRQSATPPKSAISKPIVPREGPGITVITRVHTDVEKAAGIDDAPPPMETSEPPPQIHLDLPPQSSTARKWFPKRSSRVSQASSIGHGEDAIRADTNIPELGRVSTVLHTPHDSFALPAEMARGSRHLSQTSPSKSALGRRKAKHQSKRSIGLGIDMISGALLRRSSRRTNCHRRARSSMALSGSLDSVSLASMSTRGTSVLSTRPSDFPRPPPQPTMARNPVPGLSLTASEKRKSIRLVARSNSESDDRPIADKRQSFIRNRASIGLQSPLFAHGSRAPSNNTKQTGQQSTNGSSVISSVGCSRRGKSMMMETYSESSSLEPLSRPQHNRTFSTRIRSAFAPDFPRAITQSSLGVDEEDDSSSGTYTTKSSFSGNGLAAEFALPRNQRSWVLPGEASPTPPPGASSSRRASAQKPNPSASDLKQQKRQGRLRDATPSPLSTAIAMPVGERHSILSAGKASHVRRSCLSEPISLVSTDSINRVRPRLVQTSSRRPVSVEEVRRLSSLRAETDTATTAGSERDWEDISESGGTDAGVGVGQRKFTQRSDMSGPAFL